MPAILGLYSAVLRNTCPPGAGAAAPRCWAPRVSGDGVENPERKIDPAFRRMIADKRRFFPATFTFRSCEGWEEDRELFGIMIELMEQHVAEPLRSQRAAAARRRPTLPASTLYSGVATSTPRTSPRKGAPAWSSTVYSGVGATAGVGAPAAPRQSPRKVAPAWSSTLYSGVGPSPLPQ